MQMEEFFREIGTPVLSEEDRNAMESPITLLELQQAVKGLSNQKSPGPDGLPAEIYKQFGEVLLPELLKTLNWAIEGGRLPTSMLEAIIIVLQKEGKDQLDTSSYRPISLLCSDVKILAKVLATRINKFIQKLIHPDQSGFIPNRSTSINIRRLYLNLQTPTENAGDRSILSLDATKAFDSLEWDYLWYTLEKFGFGPSFIKWIKLLYNSPKAKIKINNEVSQSSELERGTRQGCPLSPLLFALAIEPLQLLLELDRKYRGSREEQRRKKSRCMRTISSFSWATLQPPLKLQFKQ